MVNSDRYSAYVVQVLEGHSSRPIVDSFPLFVAFVRAPYFRSCPMFDSSSKPIMTFASLSGQRVLVTGSSDGIGRAIAVECATAGADLIVNCRQSIGKAVDVILADVSRESDRQHLLLESFRTGRVDAIVNNAGADLLTTELRGAEFSVKLNQLLQTDLLGTIELSRAFGQRFREQQHGAILNIGWDQSDRGMEGDSGELFATAKNAIMGFSRSLAVSLAPLVRVNCIAPGWIRTAWGATASEYWQDRVISETPLRRWGEPQDIANMARYLLSKEASYITGQVINVNGGAVR